MRFNWIVQQIDKFVSLGDLTTNGGPGMVLAFAVLMVFAKAADVPLTGSSQIYSDHEKKTVKEQTKLLAAESGKSQAGTRLVDSKTRLATLDSLILAARSARESKDSLLGPGMVERIHELERQRNIEQEAVHRHAASKASFESTAANLKASYGRMKEKLDGYNGSVIWSFEDLGNLVIGYLIWAVAAGYILGMVIGPLGRLVITWCNSCYVSTKGVRKPRLQKCMSEDTYRLHKDGIDDNLKGHSYYVGIGIISSEDTEAVRKSHYRWAELAGNMVIPTVAFSAAFLYYMGYNEFKDYLLFGMGITGAIVLGRAGRHAYCGYQYKMDSFILGRLDKDGLEKARKERDEAKKKTEELKEELKQAKDDLKKCQSGKDIEKLNARIKDLERDVEICEGIRNGLAENLKGKQS